MAQDLAMTVRLIFALWSAFSIASSLIAQGSSCPRQTTESRPGKWEADLLQPCGGVSYTIAGLNVSNTTRNCPLVMTYTPPHEVIVPSTAETMVKVDSLSAIRVAHFTCKTEWFFFIPIGSHCVLTKEGAGGFVRLMHAVPCAQAPNPQL